jgi:hypothetical protein
MSALPLPPASTFRRPPRVPTAAAVFLVGMSAVQFLNFTGFCYRDMRYYSSQQLIDRAIAYRIESHTPAFPDVKSYASVREFHQLNPNCCVLNVWGPDLFQNPWLARIFGFYRVTAELWYRYSDTDPKYPFYAASISLDACGGYAGFFGTQEERGATPNTGR